VYDKEGGALEGCESRCRTDQKCSCFDWDAANTECRFIEGQGKVEKSSNGFDAYTRE
jgi:hypothetical protein